MDGYEAARRLRARHPDRAFRLIAATGWVRRRTGGGRGRWVSTSTWSSQ